MIAMDGFELEHRLKEDMSARFFVHPGSAKE